MVLKEFFKAGSAVRNLSFSDNFLRVLVHAASLTPLGLLLLDWLARNLTADPIQAITQRTGQVAILWLFLSLSCTPLYILFEFRKPLKFKRLLGLYSFLYAALHFLTFLVLRGILYPTPYVLGYSKTCALVSSIFGRAFYHFDLNLSLI